MRKNWAELTTVPFLDYYETQTAIVVENTAITNLKARRVANYNCTNFHVMLKEPFIFRLVQDLHSKGDSIKGFLDGQTPPDKIRDAVKWWCKSMVRDRSSEAYWKPSISVSICTRTKSRVSGPSVKSVHHRFRCVCRHRASSDSLLKKLIVMEDRLVVDAERNKNKVKESAKNTGVKIN